MSAAALSPGHKEDVTEEDIRLFKSSLLARRFPELRSMPDAAVIEAIRADRKASCRKASKKGYPKTGFTPCVRPHTAPVPVWTPVNPVEARNTARRQDSECFIGIGTPYDSHHTDFRGDKVSDETKRRGDGTPFRPTSFSEAKSTIRVDYYLNSCDAETKLEEMRATQRRAAEQIAMYSQTMTQRRGQMLV